MYTPQYVSPPPGYSISYEFRSHAVPPGPGAFYYAPRHSPQFTSSRIEDQSYPDDSSHATPPIFPSYIVNYHDPRYRPQFAPSTKEQQQQSYCTPQSQVEVALEAWNRKFGEPQIRLVRSDHKPFIPGRRPGGGGVGIVYETHLHGVPLALKRTYAQKLSESDLNEVKILGQLSGKRHEHIVQLIGSYSTGNETDTRLVS
jgi:hypothetical protein